MSLLYLCITLVIIIEALNTGYNIITGNIIPFVVHKIL